MIITPKPRISETHTHTNVVLFKNLLMPLFLMGCFPVDFQEVKRPLRTKSAQRPIKAGKRPINEGKRPIKAMVLVGMSVGCLMGCFRASRPWWKTAPLTGWLRNRTGTGNRNRRNFPKPKAEPEPPEPFSWNRKRNWNRPFLLNCTETKKNLFLQRNRRNRKPEPLEPFHP